MLMARDEIVTAFEACDGSDRSKFELVENPPSLRSDLSGLLILDLLVPGSGRIVSAAEHDRIWFNVDISDLAGRITDADVLMLVRCGIHWDDDVERLTMSV